MTASPDLDGAVARLMSTVRTGDWLDAQDFPPLAWSVPGLVPEGFGLLVGPPKAGKSWAALGMALAVASGGVAFGRVRVGRPRPVLYLALEDGDRRLQDRARALLQGEPIPALLHYVTRLDPAGVPLLIAAWLQDHGSSQPLVLLDTLGKVTPPAKAGENAYGRDYRVAGVLKSHIDAHPGATFLAVHHDRKASGEDFVDSVSGTHGLAGAADFVLVLDRKRQELDAVLKVTGRDVLEAEYAISLSGGAWTLQGRDLAEAARAVALHRATAGLGDRSSQIVAIVEDNPQGISPTAIGTMLAIAPKDATQYLGRLVAAGRIAKAARGLYTPVASVAMSYPDEPSDPSPSRKGGE